MRSNRHRQRRFFSFISYYFFGAVKGYRHETLSSPEAQPTNDNTMRVIHFIIFIYIQTYYRYTFVVNCDLFPMRENKNDIHIIRRVPLLRVCTRRYTVYKPEVSIYFVRALYVYKSYNIGCRFLYIFFLFFYDPPRVFPSPSTRSFSRSLYRPTARSVGAARESVL